LLQATATDLESKLGNLAPAYGVAGNIASYFVERFVSLIFCFSFRMQVNLSDFVAFRMTCCQKINDFYSLLIDFATNQYSSNIHT
jgi:hypothetical protein